MLCVYYMGGIILKDKSDYLARLMAREVGSLTFSFVLF